MPNDRRPTKRINFTKHALENLPVPKEGRATVYDTKSDLSLRIDASKDAKTYFWFNTGAHGKPIFKRIGTFPTTSIPEARLEARKFQN